jgi:hypothetical protein
MSEKVPIGWREWIAFPALGIDRIKAKVDTGARTSALHAFFVERFERDGEGWVRFSIHPKQNDTDTVIDCEAPLADQRVVRDSGGHEEYRYVISTEVLLGDRTHQVEVTLTDRDSMQFRCLLGRTAIKGQYLVDSGRSYLLGRKRRSAPV